MTSISLTNVCKTYRLLSGITVDAVKNVTLEIESGEFLTIVGISGCGKSTLLQLIAGIENATSGTIQTGDKHSNPRLGFVFQANTVFPWRTVKNNLVYALEVRGENADRRELEARRLCQLVGLNPDRYLNKHPKELSGGEMRRVAIGMSIAYEANVLLLDEPTSQLDYVTRLSMQQMVQSLWLEQPFTAIYVTHDIEEAVFLGDRVLLMEKGAVKDAIKINLPRPRGREVLDDPVFLNHRDWILSRLEEP